MSDRAADLKVVPIGVRPRLRPSIGIAQLAATWGQPVKAIRSLIDNDELEAHYVGRAVSVFLDSAAEYQERHRRPPTTKRQRIGKSRKDLPQRPAESPGYLAAIASLDEDDRN